jgi:hypothetical protein
VEVVRADGSPAPGAVVYALPPGLPGGWKTDLLARGTADEEGGAVLRLPGEGPFDVGALHRPTMAHSLLADVCPALTPEVRIVLPETARVTVRAEESLDLPETIGVLLASSSWRDPEARPYPGRGGAYSTSTGVHLGPDGRETTLALAANASYRLIREGMTPSPDPFTPPAVVTVVESRPMYGLRVVVGVRGGLAAEGDDLFVVDLREASDPDRRVGATYRPVKPGFPLDLLSPLEVRVLVPVPSGRIVARGGTRRLPFGGEAEFEGLRKGVEETLRLVFEWR